MSEDPQVVLGLLIDHELALKRLYLAYAAALTDTGDFWLSIAEEEQEHADKLAGLRTDPSLSSWLTSGSRLRPQAIASSLEFVGLQTTRAQDGGLTLLQALAVAKDMEDALIDRQWLLPSSSEWGQIVKVLSELKADTERHRRVIAAALDTERRSRG